MGAHDLDTQIKGLYKFLSIWEQWSNVHEPLKNRTYLGKKIINFLGATFVASKSGH